ncbi:hypothetical protein H920_06560 [Fukomys damarensis]|uniref:Uncharacterized protein n=1 Tax=Fukomys damarensis TaxID=885580 RepID=A0A091E9U8_FUKDA|nr:hypothetical protein H920_06560 [Fukomys damarensis]
MADTQRTTRAAEGLLTEAGGYRDELCSVGCIRRAKEQGAESEEGKMEDAVMGIGEETYAAELARMVFLEEVALQLQLQEGKGPTTQAR